MNLPVNTLLQGGKYKIVRFIGSGGFGCTYEAEHVLLQHRVAVKEFFAKDFCNRDEYTAHVTVGTVSKKELVEKLRKKFLDEARALSKLHHESIVRVTDVFEENGTAYFVMDFIEGKSLNDLLRAGGAMPEHKALHYIRQVAEALRYVHSNNRMHLDVKPANIMVDGKGNAVLIDFGASKQYDDESGENKSTLLGKTPGYAPPEQQDNDVVRFMPATDIYALGATLYKLLTGITPPSSSKLASGDEELEMLPVRVSENTRNAVAAAMRLRKTDRPQSIGEFLSILDGEGEATVVDATRNNVSKPKLRVTLPLEPVDDGDDDEEGENESSPLKKYSIVAVCAVCVAALVYFLMPDKPVEPIKEYQRGIEYESKTGGTFTYTGFTLDGVPNDSLGSGVYKDGSFTGMYADGERKQGTYKTKDGKNVYKGKFIDDKYDEGTLTFDDGSYYRGSFKNNDFHTGKFYEKNGKSYAEIRNGKYVE